DIASPPSAAGDVLSDIADRDLKVFPRFKDLPARYTGCQISWVSVHDHWQRYAVAYLERGKPVAFFAPTIATGRKDDLVCRYRGHKIVAGSPADCPDPAVLLLNSMPAGCAKRIRSGEARPPDCEDDWRAR